MHAPRQLTAVLLLLLVSQSHVSALPPSNGGGGGGGGPLPLRPIITGSLTFVNCRPASASVRIAPAAGSSSTVAATGSFTATNGDNNIVLSYSQQLATTASGAPATSGPYSITPSTPTLCLGAAWGPAVRAVPLAPASGQDFVYIRGTPLSMDTLALALNGFIRSASPALHLNNYNPATQREQQTSVFRLNGVSVPLNIGVVHKSLDLNLLLGSVHVGTALFYVQTMSMTSMTFAAAGNALRMSIVFESADKEIKGFLQAGNIDDVVPDFQVDNAVITLTAKPVPTTAGAGITLQLSGASLSANIQATGGCSPLGVDVCDWVLGTDRILQRAIEDAINAVVGQASIQNVLAGAIQTFLRTLSVAQPLASFGLYNGNLYYVLAPPTRSPLSNFPINHDTTLIDGIVPSPVPSPRSPLNFIPINRDTTFTNDLNSLTPSPVPSPRMPLNTVPVNHGSTFSGGGVGRKLRGKRLP